MKTTKKTNIVGRIILSSIMLLGLARCNSGAQVSPTNAATNFNGGTTQSIFTGTTTATTCSGFQATIQQQATTNPGQVIVGTNITWQVNISSNGCSNLYIVRSNGAKIPVGSQNIVYYQTSYAAVASNVQETVTIVPQDSAGNPLGSPLSVSSQVFNIVAAAAATPIQCTAQASGPQGDGSYFNIAVKLSRVGQIVDVDNLAGQIQMNPDPTTLPAAQAFNFAIRVDKQGSNPIQIHIVDPANLTDIQSCLAVANAPIVIPPQPPVIVPVPGAPTCAISTSAASVTKGQTVNVTVNTGGVVNSVCVKYNGQCVSNQAGSFAYAPQASGNFEATVTGPGGSAQCSAPMNVITRVTTQLSCKTGGASVTCRVPGTIVARRSLGWAAKCGANKNVWQVPHGVTVSGSCQWVLMEYTYDL
jgi:hypothetical protein